MNRRFCLLFALALLAFPACTTRYYLVRHAERLDNSSNTPLSDLGVARADALRDTLLGKGIDSIFCSVYLRTRQTAQPLATALGEPLRLYSPDTTAGLIQQLRKLRGKDVLVVGHSDNVPVMVEALSGHTVTIAHDDYDNLFLVRITRGLGGTRTYFSHLTYGAPSP